MNFKFNHHERIAGLFVLCAFLGGCLFVLGVSVKQGWFESKKRLVAVFKNAEGVHPGTTVQMSGLNAGQVDEVELLNSNQIRITFYVTSKFSERVREDSVAQLLRPFIIGERILDVSVGSAPSRLLEPNEEVRTVEAMDLMTMVSGRHFGQQIERFAFAAESLADLAHAFLDKKRTDSLVRTFDKMEPLLENAVTLSREFSKFGKDLNSNNNFKNFIIGMNELTGEMNRWIPKMQSENPNMASDLAKISANLSQLTEDFKGVGLAFRELGPQMPETTKRAVEALNETVITLKALQKSFLLRSNVNDVKNDEARKPASK